MAFLDDAGVASLVEKLKAKMEEKADHKRVLLWYNGSPTSTFAAQTITLPAPVDAFTLWEVEFAVDTSTNKDTHVIVYGRLNCGIRAGWNAGGSYSNRGASRDCTVGNSRNNLTFSLCGYNNATDNTKMVPIAVYGIDPLFT